MRICSKVKWSGGEPATEGQMKWRWTGLLFIWWQGFSQRFRSNLQICTLKTVWRGKLGTVKFRARCGCMLHLYQMRARFVSRRFGFTECQKLEGPLGKEESFVRYLIFEETSTSSGWVQILDLLTTNLKTRVLYNIR